MSFVRKCPNPTRPCYCGRRYPPAAACAAGGCRPYGRAALAACGRAPPAGTAAPLRALCPQAAPMGADVASCAPQAALLACGRSPAAATVHSNICCVQAALPARRWQVALYPLYICKISILSLSFFLSLSYLFNFLNKSKCASRYL